MDTRRRRRAGPGVARRGWGGVVAAAATATAAAAAAEVIEERGASSLPPPPDVNAQSSARQRECAAPGRPPRRLPGPPGKGGREAPQPLVQARDTSPEGGPGWGPGRGKRGQEAWRTRKGGIVCVCERERTLTVDGRKCTCVKRKECVSWGEG